MSTAAFRKDLDAVADTTDLLKAAMVVDANRSWCTPDGARNECVTATQLLVEAIAEAKIVWVSWVEIASRDSEHLAALLPNGTVCDPTVRQFQGCEDLPYPWFCSLGEWAQRMQTLGVVSAVEVLTPEEALNVGRALIARDC